jgi:hypothetical protein
MIKIFVFAIIHTKTFLSKVLENLVKPCRQVGVYGGAAPRDCRAYSARSGSSVRDRTQIVTFMIF